MSNQNIPDFPPISSQFPHFKFPFINLSEFNNFVCYTYPSSNSELFNIKIYLPLGAWDDKIDGLNNFAMNMIGKGTKDKSANEFFALCDKIGASFHAFSTWDNSGIEISALSKFQAKALDLLLESFWEFKITEEELERQRKKMLANLELEENDPNYICQIQLNKHNFVGIPYQRPLTGSDENISQIKLKDINQQIEILQNIKPIFIISGNFDNNLIIEKLSKFFKNFQFINHQKNIYIHTNLENSKQKSIIASHKNNLNQAVLKISKLAPEKNSNEFAAFQVANTIFGGFFLSRLNAKIREEKGLTYGISSYPANRLRASNLQISSSLNSDNLILALDTILEEMKDFSQIICSEQEFIRATRYTSGNYLRSIESFYQVSSMIRNQLSLNLDNDYYDKYYAQLQNLKIDEVFEMQKKYFTPQNMIISVVAGDQQILDKVKTQTYIDQVLS